MSAPKRLALSLTINGLRSIRFPLAATLLAVMTMLAGCADSQTKALDVRIEQLHQATCATFIRCGDKLKFTTSLTGDALSVDIHPRANTAGGEIYVVLIAIAEEIWQKDDLRGLDWIYVRIDGKHFASIQVDANFRMIGMAAGRGGLNEGLVARMAAVAAGG